MAKTKTAVFTSSGIWSVPVGISAVWVTMVGGGGGCPGTRDTGSGAGSTGGAGSGELVVSRLMPVQMNADYVVTVGSKGSGSNYAVAPNAGSDTSFNGFTAKGSGAWQTTVTGPGYTGKGGGPGGNAGGSGGTPFTARGTREACNYTGGAAGSFGAVYAGDGTLNVGGVHGGEQADVGSGQTRGHAGGGGASGGSLWGGCNGGNVNSGTVNASPTAYGSGAGGSGEPSAGTTFGGSGCDGYVLLMWSGH